jgi:hypothetical protein
MPVRDRDLKRPADQPATDLKFGPSVLHGICHQLADQQDSIVGYRAAAR